LPCAIVEAMPEALSSTAQDLALRRPTEIDSLNGFVVRRGQALGVPTPENRTLQALVGLVEQSQRTPALGVVERGIAARRALRHGCAV
jgi:2-dehydropantoate 2-reductase